MLPNTRPELGSTKLFQAGGRTYTVADAVAWALARRDVDALLEETRDLSEAAEVVEEEPAEESVQKASERFRYEHDLISAGETEEWLVARGLTLTDFGTWLYQRLCLEAGPPLTRSRAGRPASEGETPALLVHLWLSDAMEELSKQYARRIAAGGDQAYARLAAEAVTPESRSRKLAAMNMSLTRIEADTLELSSAAAARETILCVRNDGDALADVARDAGYRAQRIELWGDSTDLLSAREGDVVGPIESDGRYKVYQVVRRQKPSLDDPLISRRIDDAIIGEFFDDLCSRHIAK